MKKIIYSILSVAFISIALISCVDDTDYETPQVSCTEPVLVDDEGVPMVEVTMQAVIDAWVSVNDSNNDGDLDDPEDTDDVIVQWDNTNKNYFVGYVTSDDRTGNFYKEVFIQNDPTNPTLAMKVALDMRSLYTKYNVGRKVYIKLKGLSFNKIRGEMFLGEIVSNRLDEMNESTIRTNIYRNCEAVEITPKVIASPEDITDADLGMFVQFDNLQFDSMLLDATYVDPSESYDTDLPMTHCDNNSIILLETSSFSNFKLETVAQGRGSIKGILTRDYSDSNYVLRINGVKDISFNDERCDPAYIFYENFETQIIDQKIAGNGWTNYIEEGSQVWEAFESNGSSPSIGVSARISAYNSGDASTICWLITPEIDFDEYEGEKLSFKTSNSYSDSSNLEFLYATDWDGTQENIVSANWQTVPDAYIVQNSDFYGDWFSSGEVDFSTATGTMHFAFVYTGSGSGSQDGTYELDDFGVSYTP